MTRQLLVNFIFKNIVYRIRLIAAERRGHRRSMRLNYDILTVTALLYGLCEREIVVEYDCNIKLAENFAYFVVNNGGSASQQVTLANLGHYLDKVPIAAKRDLIRNML